ncbi:UNVERIFIED_CONTAM: hypothetical protein FKN15_065933 [Acipenser sinensis]
MGIDLCNRERSVLTVWRMRGSAARGWQPHKIRLSVMAMTRRGWEKVCGHSLSLSGWEADLRVNKVQELPPASAYTAAKKRRFVSFEELETCCTALWNIRFCPRVLLIGSGTT